MMNNPEEVKKYMTDLKHDLKTEIEAVRNIIKEAGPELDEQIKWNAPSFSYKGVYVVTFNLFPRKDLFRLVFHHPRTPEAKSDIFEGDFKDRRRMVIFKNMKDVESKRSELKKIVKELMQLTK